MEEEKTLDPVITPSKPKFIRFNLEADNDNEIIYYLKNRSIQLIQNDFSWDGNINKLDDWGIMVNITYNNETYRSV